MDCCQLVVSICIDPVLSGLVIQQQFSESRREGETKGQRTRGTIFSGRVLNGGPRRFAITIVRLNLPSPPWNEDDESDGKVWSRESVARTPTLFR